MTPYRERGGESAPREVSEGDLLKLSATGRAGQNGAHGSRGLDGTGRGADGERGANAGPAGRGEDGGSIAIRVRGSGDTRVIVAGEVASGARGKRAVNEELTIGQRRDVVLFARGGPGGAGGDGGQGGDGARGAKGRDATRYSSGGDGGRGGDGGAGGNGSDGGDGGDGGEIVVLVDEAQTHLLMLLRHRVDGGEGGRPGANGPGGRGGPGGEGGDSYSWSTSESYTDANGNRQTRTRHHSNSGGDEGPSGHSGPDGNAKLDAGRDGAPGRFTIRVRSGTGATTEYGSRYALSLVDVAHVSENRDGIHEPEERIVLSRIIARNSGGMPTPSAQPIRVELTENDWVIPETRTVELPRAIAAGAEVALEDALSFIVRPTPPLGPGEPFVGDGRIVLRADVPAVSRELVGFAESCHEDKTRFLVRYPLRLAAIDTLHSLAPGESALLRFAIENGSKKAFGARSEIGRVIEHTLKIDGGSIGPHQARFEGASGQRGELGPGVTGSVDTLDAGSGVVLEGTLTIGDNAVPYEALRVVVSLGLGRIKAPDDAQTIHQREFVVRVAQRYRPEPGASVLLVVHNRTRRDELDAWRRVAAELGLLTAVWDVSLEGHLDLDTEISGGTLAEQFAGKTIVVLNEKFDTPRGERHPFTLVDPEEALRFCAAGGSIVVVGAAPPKLERLMVPIERVDTSALTAPTDGELPALFAELAVTATRRVRVEKNVLFGTPREKQVAARAARLARAADQALPDGRVVVSYDFDPVKHDVAGFLSNWWVLGSISLARTLDVDSPGVRAVEVGEGALHDPAVVEETLAPLALASGLPGARLYAALVALSADAPRAEPSVQLGFLTTDSKSARDWALHVAASEIARELTARLARPWVACPQGAEPDPGLPRLEGIAALIGGETLDPDSPRGAAVVELLAVARATAWSFVAWWELLPPLLLFRYFAPPLALYRRVRAVTERLFARAFAAADDERRATARRRFKAAMHALDAEARSHNQLGGRQRVHHYLWSALAEQGLRVFDQHASWIVPEDERRQLEDDRERRAAGRARVATALQEAREDRIVG